MAILMSIMGETRVIEYSFSFIGHQLISFMSRSFMPIPLGYHLDFENIDTNHKKTNI